MAGTISRYSQSSPTAQLLRNSRLFAVPAPLPKPDFKEERAGFQHWSATSTLPYPTIQVIQTPNHHRKKGEWGLKRQLPLKTTENARGITIREHDTHDEITDFMPATHHTKALSKIQEMGLVITRNAKIGNKRALVQATSKPSAFDEDFDHTALSSRNQPNSMITEQPYALPKRWRVRGPNLRDMTPAQFDEYLETQVRGKQPQFMKLLDYSAKRDFVESTYDYEFSNSNMGQEKSPAQWLLYAWLKTFSKDQLLAFFASVQGPTTAGATAAFEPQVSFEKFLTEYLEDETHRLSTNNQPISSILAAVDGVKAELPAKWKTFWDYYLSNIRNTSATSRSVRQAIEDFLDLPTSVLLEVDEYRLPSVVPRFRPAERSLPTDVSYDTAQILLSTHPSAGLAYRRTSRVLSNHPLYGPLAQQKPLPARVLYPRPAPTNRMAEQCFGVGGVAATTKHDLWTPHADALTERHGDHGQGRTWVCVQQDGAEITPAGRLNLRIEQASNATQFVAENELGSRLAGAWEREQEVRERKVNDSSSSNNNNNMDGVRRFENGGAKPIDLKRGGDGFVESLVD